MKFRTYFTTPILALAAIFFAVSASASYTAGDVFLGFRATSGQGNTQTVLIDVGNFSKFTSAVAPLSLGNFGTELSNTFSSSWNTLDTVLWSGIAYDPATKSMFNTIAEVTLGVAPAGYASRSGTSQASTGAQVANVGFQFNSGLIGGEASTVPANSGTTIIENSSDSNYWVASNRTPSWSVAGWNLEGNFGGGSPPGSSGTGAAVAQLAFYRIAPTPGGTGGIFLGTFSINDNGNVTYVPAVPEPASALLLGLGAIGLLARRGRSV